MVETLRFPGPRAGDDRRWFVGLSVASRCQEVSAALVAVRGRGLEARIDVVGRHVEPARHEAIMLFQQLSGQGSPSLEQLGELRALLAETQAAAVGELLGAQGIAASRILALGVCDAGWWKAARPNAWSYAGLCNAWRLAESSGLSVVDAFPARDLAQGGQGGPLAALPEWLILRDPPRDRILLDLGRTTRLSLLPAGEGSQATGRILSFEVGPGTRLLDELAQRFSGGQHKFDPGGRLAVQGRHIPDLLDHWLANPYFERAVPRWHPHGVRPERFLGDALELAVRNGWAVRDLLCTATHLVAESIARAFCRRLPGDLNDVKLIVSGGGQHNGLLLQEITTRAGSKIVKLEELLPQPEALEPACAAVLAMCYIDQTPANLPACTGAELPRLLGRLTPGSPQNWQRLLATMHESHSTARPLRAAL